jgi:tetratricopeptide (TPR) repeat protein
MEFYEAAHDDPMSFDLNLDIAETEHEVGHPMQAIPYYEKALRIPVDSQTSAQVLARLAQAYSDIGERARAREYYQTALQMQSLPPHAA